MLTTSVSLLDRLRDPNERMAWNRFVDLYTPLFYSWARRLGLREVDAADTVQEFLVLLLHKLPAFTYDPERSFRAWMRTVFRNWSRDWLDRRRRSARVGPVEGVNLSHLAAPDPGDPLEAREYRAYIIRRALKLLEIEFQPITWKAFQDYMLGGRSPAVVAQELGITTNAVYLAKARVLRRMREELTGLLD